MVDFQDSINLVKENLRDQEYTTKANASDPIDHDQILRDYDNLMREHERRMDGHRRHVKRHRDDRLRSRSRSRSPKATSMRFRFKSDGKRSSEKARKHRSRDYDDRKRSRDRSREVSGDESRQSSRRYRTRSAERQRRERSEEDAYEANISAYAAHPFARPKQSAYLDPAAEEVISESTSPQPERPASNNNADNVFEGPDDAFRSSLFDAIADDEGAAYWEGVYGEPIHVYQRPSVQTETGVLEQMGDDEYAEYVKKRMWEKKNPEIVRERAERARRREEEEKRQKRRTGGGGEKDDESGESDFEWFGNDEKGYERRRIRGKARQKEHARPKGRSAGFMSDVDAALARGARRKEAKRWQQAWDTYKKKWEDLKGSTEKLQGSELANAIPWPVTTGSLKDVERDSIEDFFRNCPLGEGETRTGLLKAERFRWHPDKIQHRFGGENVDVETLKLVTSVFQMIDEMMAKEKQREGRT